MVPKTAASGIYYNLFSYCYWLGIKDSSNKTPERIKKAW